MAVMKASQQLERNRIHNGRHEHVRVPGQNPPPAGTKIRLRRGRDGSCPRLIAIISGFFLHFLAASPT